MAGALYIGCYLGLKLAPLFYVSGAIITGLPGISIQLLLVPLLVDRMETMLKGRGKA
jgi:hypothetical protein